MKRIFTLCIAFVILLTGCASPSSDNNSSIDNNSSTSNVTDKDASNSNEDSSTAQADIIEEDKEPYLPDNTVSYDDLNDPELLEYVEDEIYAGLDSNLDDTYNIENISTTYISQEYIEELEFNSRENVFFGYTLKELDAQFKGTRYVFTLGKNGQTTVEALKEYDDTFEKTLKNVAVGTGVILICVTVSAVTAGAGAPVVSLVFATAAKTGTTVALSSGAMGGLSAGIVTALQTKDPEQTLKTAALNASEGFKWGAIAGAATGALSQVSSLYLADHPTWRESEIRAQKKFGGEEQVSYLNGEKVVQATKECSRPDIIRKTGKTYEAIEVKNYNLESRDCVAELYSELKREVGERIVNLPDGFTQRVVLDIKGRGYSNATVQAVMDGIQVALEDIYPNIPITLMG